MKRPKPLPVAETPMNLLLRATTELAQRAICKMTPDERKRFRAPPPIRDQAVLHAAPAIEMLRQHPAVRAFQIDPHQVVDDLRKLLAAASKAPAEEVPMPPLPRDVCRGCGSDRIVRDELRHFWGCTACGCECGPFVSDGDPYRTLEDQPDRRHFEAPAQDCPREALSHVAGAFGFSRSAVVDAEQLLRRHVRTGRSRWSCAIAALLAVTLEYDAATGRLQPPAPPPRCACHSCRHPHPSRRSAWLCCRGNARALKASATGSSPSPK